MKAAEKVHVLSQTPHDLADQFIADAVDSGGDTDTAIAAFLKGMKGRYRGLLDAALVELFEFYMDGKTPKARKKSESESEPDDADEKEAKRLEAMAKRLRAKTRTAETEAYVKTLILMELETPFGPLGDCTGAQGKKLTGWMGRVFKGVGVCQRLRDVKTEADILKIKTWRG